MENTSTIQPVSANLKKAISWLSETILKHPDKDRSKVIWDAELRFDLTPKECEFLNKNFAKKIK